MQMVLSKKSCVEKALGEEKASSCQPFEGIPYIPGKSSAGTDYSNYHILSYIRIIIVHLQVSNANENMRPWSLTRPPEVAIAFLFVPPNTSNL